MAQLWHKVDQLLCMRTPQPHVSTRALPALAPSMSKYLLDGDICCIYIFIYHKHYYIHGHEYAHS